MNFFEHQEVARKKSGRLVFLFIAAVLSIIGLVYFASLFILQTQVEDVEAIALPLLAGVVAVVLVIVGGGSLFKTAQLSVGGSAVAEIMGGTPVQRETADADAKRLLNVVEEMSIASGSPMPEVYVMEDEEGINAFAAGHSIDDAAIAVTRGTIQHLTRDELQGVIAHEFSHIFNGDMRLNMRLMGVLHGILLLGLIGGFILRGSFYSGGMRTRSRRSNRSGGDSHNAIMLFALALTVIGYLGTFFGGLIKSAISRQREYLADASAVQFTRNPAGIGGALKKIGALSTGSLLQSPRAEEASHLFFGQGIKSSFGGLTATHPPLVERIQRIDPSFQGDFSSVNTTRKAEAPQPQKEQDLKPRAALIAALATIGAPSPQHVAHARELVDSIPPRLRESLSTTWGARAAVLALLLDSDPVVRSDQFDLLSRKAESDLLREIRAIESEAAGLALEARLPLLDLALAPLRGLTRSQYEDFRSLVDALARADRKLDLFEWMLGRAIRRHVGAIHEPRKTSRVRFKSTAELEVPLATLLGAVARAGHSDETEIQRAYEAGASAVGLDPVPVAPKAILGFEALDPALDQLRLAAPLVKQEILAGCAATIAADQHVTVAESELFRGIADALECPVPPLLAGQALAVA